MNKPAPESTDELLNLLRGLYWDGWNNPGSGSEVPVAEASAAIETWANRRFERAIGEAEHTHQPGDNRYVVGKAEGSNARRLAALARWYGAERVKQQIYDQEPDMAPEETSTIMYASDIDQALAELETSNALE